MEHLKSFIEELDQEAENPALYNELVSKTLLQEVLDALKDLKKNRATLVSYISAVESATSRLSYELDKASFGLGFSRALTTLIDMRLKQENNADTNVERQYRCFKTYEGLLAAIASHPHFSHTELAKEIGKSKGRLSQIVVQLKENHLVLVDKLGKENRYELTTVARNLMRQENATFSNTISRHQEVAEQAQTWLNLVTENNSLAPSSNDISQEKTKRQVASKQAMSNTSNQRIFNAA